MPKTRHPLCPECASAASWIRSTPARPGFVTHAYECPKCMFIVTMIDPDPMNLAEGWLKGELKPPGDGM